VLARRDIIEVLPRVKSDSFVGCGAEILVACNVQLNRSKGVIVMGESHISSDVSDENAAKQVHESIEGTLMGWIRASLSLIGFGFALGEGFHLVRTGGPKNIVDTLREYLISTVTVGLIVLGVVGLLGAVIQCGWSLKRLKQGSVTTYEKPWYLSMLVAVLLMIIGLVALVTMALP
jgi:putative membrane protein